MKYVLMFADSAEDQKSWEKMTPDQMHAAYEQINNWFEEHSKSGKIVGGEELRGPASSTTVRFKNGKAIVTDGPFIQAKEIVCVIADVEDKNLEEGLAMADPWP